jgi:hypothetical protein
MRVAMPDACRAVFLSLYAAHEPTACRTTPPVWFGGAYAERCALVLTQLARRTPDAPDDMLQPLLLRGRFGIARRTP